MIVSKLAAEILASNLYGALATCSPDGNPWCSPIYYSYNSKGEIFWASAETAVHSKNLFTNPKAFIAVYNSAALPRTASGLYLSGLVTVAPDLVLDEIVRRHFGRVNENNGLTGKDYSNGNPERIFCFTTQNVWILGNPEDIGGRQIDKKVSVELTDFYRAVADAA
jgi:hypothetical protein